MDKLLAVFLCCLCSYVTAAETKYWVNSSSGPDHMVPLQKGSWLSVDFDNLVVRGELLVKYPGPHGGYYFFNPETVGPYPGYPDSQPQVVNFDSATNTLTMLGFYAFHAYPQVCRHACVAMPAGDIFLSLVFNNDKTAFVSSSPLLNSLEVWASQVQFDLHSDPSNVPVPAAAWLFGSGLLGLAGLTRKSRAA